MSLQNMRVNESPNYKNYKNIKISDKLDKTILDCRTIMNNTMELNVMEINIGDAPCAVVTIEGMVSTSSMAELIFRPLMELKVPATENPSLAVYRFVTKESLLAAERHILYTYGDVVQDLFSGFALIFIDGIPKGISMGIQGYAQKSISQPTSENNIMGSQEAFAEVIRTNISLIRRRMKSPALRFEMMQVGEQSSTDVCMVYMVDKAPPKIVDEIRKKLSSIKLDTIISSGYIKPFLEKGVEENLFSNIGHTERPDVLCTKINDGKVCVLIDGTPFALVCPVLFSENFKTIDDYCSKNYFATYLRWIRYFAFFLAVAFPGIYVATASYHPEMLNLKLLLNLSASEQATPYPLFFEILIIMALLELMREASIRLPSAVGSAISIVGGLVIGDAAVKSGIISAPLLIIVGLTATASFIIPSLNQQTSVLRLAFIFSGGAAGFFGIAVCGLIIIANICAMDEFNIPYTSPVTPFSFKGIKDVFARASFKSMEKDHSTVEDYTEDKLENF
ncbi:MAG: spore germination protein [Oscillospiraceae bacterium]